MTCWDLTNNLVQYPTLTQVTDMLCLDNLYSDALFVTDLAPVFILGMRIDKSWLGRVGKKRQLRGLCWVFHPDSSTQCKYQNILEDIPNAIEMFWYPRVLESKIHAFKNIYSPRISLLVAFFSIKFSNNLITNSLIICIMDNSIIHQEFFANFQC